MVGLFYYSVVLKGTVYQKMLIQFRYLPRPHADEKSGEDS